MPRTAHGLYRRAGSPFWQASWTDAAGQHHRESTGCRDRKNAETWIAAREMERVREQAGVPVARAIALPDAAAEYLAEKAAPVWAVKWWQTAEGMFRLQMLGGWSSARMVERYTHARLDRLRNLLNRPENGAQKDHSAPETRNPSGGKT